MPHDRLNAGEAAPSLLVVTNMATHYRLPLFQRLATVATTEFVFFSDGGESYWGGQELPDVSSINAIRVRGPWVGRTRLTPGLALIVLRTDADAVVKCVNGKFALPVTYASARIRRRPFVLWTGIWQHPRQGLNRFSEGVMRYLYRHSDAIVTYGRHVSDYVVHNGADRARVFVAPQAIDTSLYPRQPQQLSRDQLTVLFVGRLEPEKGADIAVQATLRLRHELPGLRLTVIGDGPLRQPLRDLVDRAQGDAMIQFKRRVPPEEMAAEYAAANVVVVPSVTSTFFAEPWSLVVNEAMSCGRLVIASSAVGAVRDGLVEDGVTGLVFKEGDTAGLVAALQRAAAEPELVQRLVEAAGQRVADYSLQAAAQAFVLAAQAAIEHRARARRAKR